MGGLDGTAPPRLNSIVSDPNVIRNLGLFPLGLVVLPGERVPLHIFEPRYRALVADCALESRTFVISLAGEAGVAKIGCEVQLDALTRRFADGRMNIVVVGLGRVELLEQTDGELYVTARARSIPDADGDVPAGLAASVIDGFRRLAQTVAGAPADPDLPEGVPVSYAVAAGMDLDAVTKQRLLEDRSEPERLRTVLRLLDEARAGLDRQEVAAERAKTNGKVTLH
jgi:Lon protease-like protein